MGDDELEGGELLEEGELPPGSPKQVEQGHNLTKKELKKLKKRMMKMQKQQGGGGNHGGHAHAQQQQGQPHEQFYNVYGANAQADVEVKSPRPIQLRDVQGLALWVLGDAPCPKWVFTKIKPLIGPVVMVLANGLTQQLFEQHKQQMPVLAGMKGPATVVALNSHTRASHTANHLLTVPFTKKRKREVEEATKNPAAANGGGAGPSGHAGSHGHHGQPPFPPEHYVLTALEMQGNKYPVPTLGSDGQLHVPEGYTATRKTPGAAAARAAAAAAGGAWSAGGAPPPPPPPQEQQHNGGEPPAKRSRKGKGAAHGGGGGSGSGAEWGMPPWAGSMVALDCEMCITQAGFELTRCTLVDAAGRVLMDELVVPHNPITDYNTRYSGITPQMLQGVMTRLEDVQRRFLELVCCDTLLVGHSLENDLVSLKIVHSKVLDTALLFPHPRGPPYKSALRMLAQRHLKRSIQDGSHDSVIDARTAMDLMLLKIKHGPSYGTSEAIQANKLVDVLASNGRKSRSCLVDKQDALSRHATGAADAVLAASDAQAAALAARHAASGRYGFVWAQLHDLDQFFWQRSKHARRAQELRLLQARMEAGPAGEAVTADGEQRAAAAGDGAAAGSVRHAEAGGAAEVRGSAGEGPSKADGALTGAADKEAAEQLAAELAAEAPKYSTEALQQQLRRLDQCVGSLLSGLPPNALLIVATGQGDMPECRRQHELKIRRQQGLDGLPAWSTADEAAFGEMMEHEMMALCFCVVRQGSAGGGGGAEQVGGGGSGGDQQQQQDEEEEQDGGGEEDV